MDTSNKDQAVSLLQQDLSKRYGEVIGGDTLRLVLGFATMSAFKAAISRETLTLPTFFIKGRKGRHALTSEVAAWLIECRANVGEPSHIEMPESFKRAKSK
jgi:hypothetical protein